MAPSQRDMDRWTEDYYARLRVKSTATSAEITQSYRKLAVALHPDKNKDANATQVFQELQEAYEVLKDDDTRAQYTAVWRIRIGNTKPTTTAGHQPSTRPETRRADNPLRPWHETTAPGLHAVPGDIYFYYVYYTQGFSDQWQSSLHYFDEDDPRKRVFMALMTQEYEQWKAIHALCQEYFPLKVAGRLEEAKQVRPQMNRLHVAHRTTCHKLSNRHIRIKTAFLMKETEEKGRAWEERLDKSRRACEEAYQRMRAARAELDQEEWPACEPSSRVLPNRRCIAHGSFWHQRATSADCTVCGKAPAGAIYSCAGCQLEACTECMAESRKQWRWWSACAPRPAKPWEHPRDFHQFIEPQGGSAVEFCAVCLGLGEERMFVCISCGFQVCIDCRLTKVSNSTG